MRLKRWYDAHVMPRLITCACGQEGIERRRREIVPLARGRVLELGCGGGLNQQFYEAGRISAFAGIDPHEKLLEGARARASAHGWEVDIRAG
ncbi:MAG: class I SAM-dependent methyltransferase, partial [Pseudomonadota bacterium]|nr:class I SAM-dependent methyltransferase [Pseudomonadota bacterium]